jgi:hypothetical protein
MNSPSYLEEPQVAYLGRIIQDVKNGSILIPRFQRKFVWNIEDRLKLLESIRDGIPIGSFLVWRTSDHSLDTFPSIGGIKVPKGPVSTPGIARQYLLDGHQRLSTLFNALSSSSGLSGVDLDLDSDLLAGDIIYNLRAEEFEVTSRRSKNLSYLLPLGVLLDSISLLKFQRDLISEFDADMLVSRADTLANRFRNYKIPIIPIVTDDLEAATRAFERINSTGVRMDDYHMVAALTYSKNFSLSDKIEEAKERLQEISWGDLDEKYILAVIRAREGLDISSPNALSTSQFIKRNPGVISEAVTAISDAASFFRHDCLMPSPDFIPYSYQFVFMSYAFFGGVGREIAILEKLKSWLWRTTYTGFFRGARESDLRRAKQQIDDIILGVDDFNVKGEPKVIIRAERGKFDFRSARSRAIVNRIAHLRVSKTPHRSEDVLYTMSVMGSRCLHPIVSSRQFSGSESRNFENRFLVAVDENIDVRGDLERAFLFGDDAFLASHGVNRKAVEDLLDGDAAGFFARRRELILAEEKKFVEGLGFLYLSKANSTS